MLETIVKNSNLMNWENIPVENLSDGVERQMIVGENLMICRVKFPPFAVATLHEHPHEQMTIVVKGRTCFIVGDEEKIVESGDVIHIPPHSRHGATMLDDEVILIDIFTPIREDFLSK